MMVSSTTVTWLAAVVMLTTITNAEGIRGERRGLEFSTQHNDLYNGSNGTVGDNEEAHEILHQVDFPGHLDVLGNLTVGKEAIDGRDDVDNEEPKNTKRSKSPKSTKAPKIDRKRAREEKHHKKGTKGTPMPTVSSAPSSMPSISNQPSISVAPSSYPTVSPMPSVSSSPSSTPTDSPMPTVSGAPTSTPVVISAGAPEPSSEVSEASSPSAVISEAKSPSPAPMIEVLTKFALLYALNDDADPTTSDLFALSKVTGWYLGNHTMNHYSNIDSVTFLKTEITSYYEPSPLVIDYDAMSCFDEFDTYPIPTNDELNGVIAFAFTARADQYLAFLKSHLDSSNPFSSVTFIDYSTYWDALVSQTSTVASPSNEPIDEGNSNSKEIFAPIIAIAGTVIVVACAFIVARQRKRRNDASRVNANRWDESGANLHMSKKLKAEDDMVVLDDQAPSGEHSFRPSIRATLSPVDEVDSDDGALVMGEMPETSPSEVMREMDLSSALEDVDLDNDTTGGIGEMPRNKNGGIGELPGRR
jgi:hypothetical protein